MPWGFIQKPSLAIPVLKRCANAAGFNADVHYLNIRFAQQLGLDLYEKIADATYLPSEWFFSQHLFGPSGSGELQNSWDSLKSNPATKWMADQLQEITVGSEEIGARIATEHVPRFIDDCITAIDWSQYLAVGFTTTFAQSLSSLLLAKRIKELNRKTKIIFGGANVDSEMGVEYIRAFEWVDYVVHGEAEVSFPALLNMIESESSPTVIPGVSSRLGNQVSSGADTAVPIADLDTVPIPDYSDYLAQLTEAGFRNTFPLRLWFESARGCWWGAKHHCTFCGFNREAMTFRKKSAERVVSELLTLSREHQCFSFAAADNILATEYFSNVVPKLANSDVDLDIFYQSKSNLTYQHLKSLAQAGIKYIQPGIESLNSRILALMKKGATAIQNVQLLKWCAECFVSPTWNILYGFPGETADDYADLPRILRLIQHCRPPNSFGMLLFERFSPYYFRQEDFNLKLAPAPEYSLIYPESRVRLEKVAYLFEDTSNPNRENSCPYIQPAINVWEQWKNHWANNEVFCNYKKVRTI